MTTVEVAKAKLGLMFLATANEARTRSAAFKLVEEEAGQIREDENPYIQLLHALAAVEGMVRERWSASHLES
jgi:hypothetical protein